jgi:hypothetical protein
VARLARASSVTVGVALIVLAAVLATRPSASSLDAQQFGVLVSPTAVPVPSASTITPPAPTAPGEGSAVPASTTAPPIADTAAPPAGVAPARIELPAHHTGADVVPVAVLGDGSLQLPDDPRTIGWWVAGAAPGAAAGDVVLAGHVDTHRLGIGTFAVLRVVSLGEEIDVIDVSGAVHTYTVIARQQLAKAQLPMALFDPSGPPALVLITCGGAFDRTTRHYADNVIVVATPT